METVRISVRNGEIGDAGSWLYVWAQAGSPEVVYVGGTSLPPALRTWLHLHHEEPDVGRIAHRRPGAGSEAFTVLACRIPDDLDRPAAKAALIARLHAEQLLAADYVGDPPGTTEVSEAVRPCVDEVVASVKTELAS